MFDTTINLGVLIQTIGLIGSFIYFIWSIKSKLDIMDHQHSTMIEDVKLIKMELNKITSVIIEQAKQSTRLDHLEDRVIELINKFTEIIKK